MSNLFEVLTNIGSRELEEPFFTEDVASASTRQRLSQPQALPSNVLNNTATILRNIENTDGCITSFRVRGEKANRIRRFKANMKQCLEGNNGNGCYYANLCPLLAPERIEHARKNPVIGPQLTLF